MANETILIVDDSAEIVNFLKRYALTPQGFNVISASDGRSGLDMAIEHNPDLILLDMSMPQMTGIEMLQALRQTLCQAPVIFMTMFGSENVAVEAFRLGVRDYLSKPFTVDEVQQAVERALRETRLARERESLLRDLIAAATIRRTVATLTHYVNNDLFIVNGGLGMLALAMQQKNFDDVRLPRVVHDSMNAISHINAVLRVMEKLTRSETGSLPGPVEMIDIDEALRHELE